jgi:large subunit ribosomal protein L21
MTMRAVFESGGKQYLVRPGDIVQIDKLIEPKEKMTFDKVLLCVGAQAESPKVTLGKPYVSGAKVEVELVGTGRGDKILIYKMKRRKKYRRTQGHRQDYNQVLVLGIDNGSGEKFNITDTDRSAKLKTFQSHLTPKYGKVRAEKGAGEKTENSAAKPAAAKTKKAAAPKKAKA